MSREPIYYPPVPERPTATPAFWVLSIFVSLALIVAMCWTADVFYFWWMD